MPSHWCKNHHCPRVSKQEGVLIWHTMYGFGRSKNGNIVHFQNEVVEHESNHVYVKKYGQDNE